MIIIVPAARPFYDISFRNVRRLTTTHLAAVNALVACAANSVIVSRDFIVRPSVGPPTRSRDSRAARQHGGGGGGSMIISFYDVAQLDSRQTRHDTSRERHVNCMLLTTAAAATGDLCCYTCMRYDEKLFFKVRRKMPRRSWKNFTH